MVDPYTLPDDLPRPADDGAADHLTGMTLPTVEPPATDGSSVELAALKGRTSSIRCFRRTATPPRCSTGCTRTRAAPRVSTKSL
jgi:peroxiredoxin